MSPVISVFSAVTLCVFVSVLFRITITSLDRWPLPQDTDFVHTKQLTDKTMNAIYANLFWFIQVSDIHISAYRDLNRGPDLKSFIQKHIAILRPEVVIVSGDLTDGRKEQYFNSGQQQTEWDAYQKIISDTAVTSQTMWLDSRGNHDTFDVPDQEANQNYFRSRGVQGSQDEWGYVFTLNKPYGQYSFIGVDLCPRTGIKFPLNFFGIVTSEHERRLAELAQSSANSNQTFWIGHYPTSTIIPSKADFRGILGKHAFAYLSGHLHTLFGLVPRLYTVHPHGFLELELGDWRDNRIFRIVAVDHDLVSFADYKYHGASDSSSTEWPIALITNPKDAIFLMPHKEPAQRIANSTHIRILAWSPWPITSVSVEINSVYLGRAIPASSSVQTNHVPLYVLPWQPSKYAPKQSHWITVTVQDAHGNRRVTTQPFVVDGRPIWKFPFFARLVLHLDYPQLLKMIYYLLLSLITFSLLLPRCLPRRVRTYCLGKRLFRGWFRLGTSSDLQVPVVLYLMYSLTCPLYMGFLLTNHFGIVFSYGVYVAGSFILESLTYLYEICQLCLFSLTVLLGLSIYLAYYDRPRSRVPRIPNLSSIDDQTDNSTSGLVRMPCASCAQSVTTAFCSIPWTLCLLAGVFSLFQVVFLTYTVALPYDWLAAFLSPGRLGLIPFTWFLFVRAAA